MEDSFLDRLRTQAPLNFAHRGARKHAPENTLAAFHRALEHGADGIELDIRLCGTGEWVVFHDSKLNRTTDGRGYVRTKSLAEIRRCDAGIKFSERFRSERVPTLAEVLEMAQNGILLNIEIKSITALHESHLANLLALLYRHHAERRCIVSSFNPIVLRRLAQLDLHVPRGLLLTPNVLTHSARMPLRRLSGVQALHLHARVVTPPLLDKVRALGLYLLVWGADTTAQLNRMVGLGVDAIITDEPLELSKILGSKHTR